MRAAVNAKLGPPEAATMQNFSDQKTGPKDGKEVAPSTQFVDLIRNSNAEAKKAQEAREKGDLSTAKDDSELFEMLSDQTSQQRVPKNKLDKDDFLKLFVTQLQNQDPLKPKDNTEMAAQLAQFNGLEQMLNVNKNLEKMSAAQKESQSTNLLAFIGKEITLEGGQIGLKHGQATGVTFEVGRPVSTAMAKVLDSNGEVVYQQPLGKLEPGNHPFHWHGKDTKGARVPDGRYTYAVEATDDKGLTVEVPIRSKVMVSGINLRSGEKPLKTSLGDFNFSDVVALESQIREDKRAPEPATEGAPEPAAEPTPVATAPTSDSHITPMPSSNGQKSETPVKNDTE